MAKNIVIKLKKAGNRVKTFSISDDRGNLLLEDVSKESLISGLAISVNDNVNIVILRATNSNCCSKSINIPITTTNIYDLANVTFEALNTGSVWRHLTDITIYNKFYGCTNPYILEYPFSYQYYDEIVQNIKDYTKVFKYTNNQIGVYDNNAKIQTNRDYFNKVILYNDQQSSGLLELVPKPINNLKDYLTYPKYNSDSRTIIFTKSDNFYQFNTFWDIVKDNENDTIFSTSCDSLSIDKELNQENHDYIRRSFQKYKIRGKDLKTRFILDDRSNIKLISQIILSPSQISYK